MTVNQVIYSENPIEIQRNTGQATVQQPEKKCGLFGRLVKAVLERSCVERPIRTKKFFLFPASS